MEYRVLRSDRIAPRVRRIGDAFRGVHGREKSPRAKALADSVLPFHGVGEKNVVLIGTDDLIEIIPGTHISSIAIGSSAEIDPCAPSQ
jgi:hypothetical protein